MKLGRLVIEIGWSLIILTIIAKGEQIQPIANGSVAKENLLADFQEFSSRTPPLEMIAEVCDLDRTMTTNRTFKCRFVLLRYQTNAMFYREAPSLQALMSTNVFPRLASGPSAPGAPQEPVALAQEPGEPQREGTGPAWPKSKKRISAPAKLTKCACLAGHLSQSQRRRGPKVL